MIAPELLTQPHVKPLGDQIVILPEYVEVRERKSSGGIDLPEQADNEPIGGTVVALGDGYIEACSTCFPHGKKYEFKVKIGDRVLWTPWLALSLHIEGKDFFLISERDVLGVFEDE
jgi:chaperonin GroES